MSPDDAADRCPHCGEEIATAKLEGLSVICSHCGGIL